MIARRFVSKLALLLSSLAAAPTTSAQTPDHWRGLVGNWKLEFLDKSGSPAGKGEFAFHRGPDAQARAGGIVVEPSQAPRYRDYTCTGSLNGATVKLACGTYGFTNHFSYVTLQLSADGNALRGAWATTADGREGQTRWTRARPMIRSVEVITDPPGGIDYVKLKQRWDYGGEPPSIRLRLRGEEMPLWINTYAWPHVEAAIDDPRFLIARESLSNDDLARRWERGVIEYPVQVLPGAKGGRKAITVNGVAAAFDVVLFGALEGAAKDALP